jgi:hypothetical protein
MGKLMKWVITLTVLVVSVYSFYLFLKNRGQAALEDAEF